MEVFKFFKTRKIPGFLAILVFCSGYLTAAPLENRLASISPGEARSRVIASAAQYERTPYRYGGLDKRGMDCSGFVYVSFRDALGVSIPRSTTSIYSWAEKIPVEDARPGDLLFFKTMGNGKISHVGIYVGDGRFIHAASDGPVTGVIYSSLSERYWSRTFAGAGRALPAADVSGNSVSNVTNITDTNNKNDKKATKEKKTAEKEPKESNTLLMGVAIAPTWNTYTIEGSIVRGATGQFRVGTEVAPFGKSMLLGVELRPEWDGMLGVFRIPLTVSWGLNDKIRLFIGPVVSFGDASLSISGKDRKYAGGTTWFGAAGITAAPFTINVAGNDLAPYGELAWQSYTNNSDSANLRADIAAGFRFSTGLRYTWRK